jgi:hypothetical protein
MPTNAPALLVRWQGEEKGTQLFFDKQGPKKSCVPFSSPFSSLLGLDRCRRHRVQAVTRSNH